MTEGIFISKHCAVLRDTQCNHKTPAYPSQGNRDRTTKDGSMRKVCWVIASKWQLKQSPGLCTSLRWAATLPLQQNRTNAHIFASQLPLQLQTSRSQNTAHHLTAFEKMGLISKGWAHCFSLDDTTTHPSKALSRSLIPCYIQDTKNGPVYLLPLIRVHGVLYPEIWPLADTCKPSKSLRPRCLDGTLQLALFGTRTLLPWGFQNALLHPSPCHSPSLPQMKSPCLKTKAKGSEI